MRQPVSRPCHRPTTWLPNQNSIHASNASKIQHPRERDSKTPRIAPEQRRPAEQLQKREKNAILMLSTVQSEHMPAADQRPQHGSRLVSVRALRQWPEGPTPVTLTPTSLNARPEGGVGPCSRWRGLRLRGLQESCRWQPWRRRLPGRGRGCRRLKK